MKNCVITFWLTLWLVLSSLLHSQVFPLRPGEDSPKYDLALTEKDDIAAMLRDMKRRLTGQLIDPRSRDYAMLDQLRLKPELAKKAIPELIELAGILEPKPVTTERLKTLHLSLAGLALVALRAEAEPLIHEELNERSIEPTARTVLEQALQEIEQVKKNDTARADRRQRRVMPAVNDSSPKVLKEQAQGSIIEPSAAQAPSNNASHALPNEQLPTITAGHWLKWWVLALLAVSAGLVWFLRRCVR